MADLLHSILTEASSAASPILAVFDLDSTLFDLRARIQEILYDFARDPAHQERHPDPCRKLLQVRIERKDWGLGEPLARVGLLESEHPALFEELRSHWSFRFFSDDYLHRDLPLAGAVEFVQELARAGGHILYLTGRDEPRMLSGTLASLSAWNFPLSPPESRLLLKPDAALDDAEFKAEILAVECARYGRVWFFENEPVNLRAARKRCPAVRLVFVDTNHSGREQPWPELDSIPHFETDLEAFRAFLAPKV